MSCPHCCAAQTQFDAKRAQRDLQRYRRNGADAVTRLILSALQQRELEGSHLLDVGAGIGVIAAELAKSGVARATIIEASPAYLDVARRQVGSLYPEGLTQFILEDFTSVAATLADADVVTLGRVVCCYPDAETLLHQAAGRTRRVLAFTYPRYRWFVRAVNAIQNFWRHLRGNAFQTYVHAPWQMQKVLETAGLARVAQKGTTGWMLDVYERVPITRSP
ncbi:MAG TPA: methyltransferase domain-containing protein [Terriglobales bacterium]|nr:methyltransferase domain-containing protein [Terriglobales bacterium]